MTKGGNRLWNRPEPGRRLGGAVSPSLEGNRPQATGRAHGSRSSHTPTRAHAREEVGGGPFAALHRSGVARAPRARHVVLGDRSHLGGARALCGLAPRAADADWVDPPSGLPMCRKCWVLAQGPRALGWPDGISRSSAPWVEPGEPEYAAAVLYTREAGWDHPPLVLPDQAVRYLMIRDGRLVGFAIVDWVGYVGVGRRRVVEHLWTAIPHRRQGIATALIGAALDDGPITHYAHPLTPDGEAFVGSRPPAERRFVHGRAV